MLLPFDGGFPGAALGFRTCSMWVHKRRNEYDYDMQNIHRVRVIFFLILPRNVDKLLDTMPYGTSDMYINIQQGHIWMDT